MKLLAQGSWWTLNKTVTKYLGSIEASLVLTLLCDMHEMHPDRDMVWLRQEDIEEVTGLSYYKISKAMDLLESKNLIYRERETQTVQPKMLYRVLEGNIVDLLRLKNSTYTPAESEGHNNNNFINNDLMKNEVHPHQLKLPYLTFLGVCACHSP
jgi:hypothetical protein